MDEQSDAKIRLLTRMSDGVTGSLGRQWLWVNSSGLFHYQFGGHRQIENPDDMKLAIVAYPSLDEIDRQWIESFRAKHDPQAPRLGVHFTLVFPVEAVPSELEPDLATVAGSTEPILFVVRGTKVVRDVPGNVSEVFLVPDEGGVQITTLHDRLYAGMLRPHLRSDIPFVPHMTVGAAPDFQGAESLAEELSTHSRKVRGTVENIALVNVGTRHVQTIATYTLGNAAVTSARK